MLAYSDLTLDDVSYYWKHSILLFEKGGIKIPCKIYTIDDSSTYPISLQDLRTGSRLISLRLSTFVEQVLIHHPPLGYADYKGMPLYLSPRAGRELIKGVNNDNISVLCPVSVYNSIIKKLENMSSNIRTNYTDKKKPIPKQLVKDYTSIKNTLSDLHEGGDVNFDKSLRFIVDRDSTTVIINSQKVLADLIYQCTNNRYMSINTGMEYIQDVSVVSGVSISRDFALINDTNVPKHCATIVHRLHNVGYIHRLSKDVVFNQNISSAGKELLNNELQKLGR